MREPYQRPTVHVVGSLSDLTLANVVGGFTDAAFPANTPFHQLTFSN